ncbi:MAG: photosynthetic reaction center cytochrome c subunit family protein [Acidobacteria bacterium]|nr:photosynthetic reaction center cytochrome c subunit family protein [Acidobacteriota bacterium]
MKVRSRLVVCAVTGTAVLWLLSVLAVAAPAQDAARNQMLSEEYFQNVTVLTGLTVDQFMGTMGVFSAALGLSCENCHTASSDNWALYAEETPFKETARRMVRLMADINERHFGGRQVVTCFTCHRGSTGRPLVVPSLNLLYGAPPPDELDVLVPPAFPGGPTVEEILDRYLEAVGGVEAATAMTGWVARGTYSGYGPEGTPRPVEIYARAPNQKTIVIREPGAGDNTTTFSGTAAWHSAPFRPYDVLELHEAELESARAEAELTFPVNIKQVLTGMRASDDFIDGRILKVVQGFKGAAIVTMYFDEETGLMTRLVRSTPSPVGRLPVRIDYSDYRDVAGLMMPFRWTTTWLDGRSNFELREVEPNVAIPPSLFARPAPPSPY